MKKITIEFTEDEIQEINNNFFLKSDESYVSMTAWMLFDKLKEMGLLE